MSKIQSERWIREAPTNERIDTSCIKSNNGYNWLNHIKHTTLFIIIFRTINPRVQMTSPKEEAPHPKTGHQYKWQGTNSFLCQLQRKSSFILLLLLLFHLRWNKQPCFVSEISLPDNFKKVRIRKTNKIMTLGQCRQWMEPWDEELMGKDIGGGSVFHPPISLIPAVAPGDRDRQPPRAPDVTPSETHTPIGTGFSLSPPKKTKAEHP